MGIVSQTEAAVRNSIWISELCLKKPDTLARIPVRVVLDNPVVTGSSAALVPGYNKRFPLYAPYALRDTTLQEGVQLLSLATPEYDYPSREWFTGALADQDGHWSEPYFDEGGGNLLMTTFSLPVKDADGKIAAVLTADISLDWLGSLVHDMRLYPHAMSTIVSRNGNTLIKDGECDVNKEKSHVYTAEVQRTGWTLSLSVPERDLMADVRLIGQGMVLLSILGLLMLILIMSFVAKSLASYQEARDQQERLQSELRIGRDIQMSMVPQTFPPFPDRTDLDFAASIVPAKEVGGDLYDYYIRDEKLFFCIGDVSGKGVPASLIMAKTCTLFRAISLHEPFPSCIATTMNTTLAANNPNQMFVTFFLGVLDLASGTLRYCNAGHNPPLILTDDIRVLPSQPNLPLGVIDGIEYQEQEVVLEHDDALFLYTDGLTEAENAEAQLFGEERMKQVLHGRRPSAEHLQSMQDAVRAFVGEAPQSDDLTMLFIHYLG
jgi:serine phosphatase RsbU (regulator of sigma subunit)